MKYAVYNFFKNGSSFCRERLKTAANGKRQGAARRDKRNSFKTIDTFLCFTLKTTKSPAVISKVTIKYKRIACIKVKPMLNPPTTRN